MIKANLGRWPIVATATVYYQSLAAKDRLALLVLTAFITLIFVVTALVLPITRYNTQSQLRYIQGLEDLAWMEANRMTISPQQQQRDPGQSLLGLANNTAKDYQLSFKRYEPVGDNGLSLWLDGVAFNPLILWLEEIDKQYGISVQEIAVEKNQQTGLVDVRLVLQG